MPDVEDKRGLLEGANILVTGGAGFIGSHLVDRLIIEKPKKIVVMDNLFLGRLENLDEAKRMFKNLIIYIRDASVYPVIEEVIDDEEIDVVFDLATIPLPTSYVQPRWTYENNIRIVLNLCELMRLDKFDLYIHASSSEALGTAIEIPMSEDHPMNPTTTYGASKASQDLYIQSYDRMYGLNYLIFRPFNNFGERQNDRSYAGVIPLTINRISLGKPPVLHGDGEQTRDFIYVKDTVDGVVRLASNETCRKQVIHVARGREVKIGELISLLCKLMRYNGTVIKEPARPNDVRRHFADATKVRSFIPFNPINLEDGLQRVIDWYRSRPLDSSLL